MITLQDEHSVVIVRAIGPLDLFRGARLAGGLVRFVRGDVATVVRPDGAVVKVRVIP